METEYQNGDRPELQDKRAVELNRYGRKLNGS
jgi:hypothetical protein